MRSLLVLFLLLALSRFSYADGKGFVSAGLGASGSQVTDGTNFYTPGIGGLLGGGFIFGIVDIRAELLYNYSYTTEKKYEANRSKGVSLTTFLGVLVGISPFNFLNLSVGYGLGLVGISETYSSGGTNYQEDRSTDGSGWVLGADLWPFHLNNGKVDLGVVGRMFAYSSDNYTRSVIANGTTTTTDIQGTTKSSAWLILGALRIHF